MTTYRLLQIDDSGNRNYARYNLDSRNVGELLADIADMIRCHTDGPCSTVPIAERIIIQNAVGTLEFVAGDGAFVSVE